MGKATYIKNILLKHPMVVQIIKRGYKSHWLNNQLIFRRIILNRALKADVAWVPQGITLETVATCNARCVMCAHSEKHLAGGMNMLLFKKIVDQLRDLGFGSVGLSVYGEPLMDKYWIERINYLKSKDIRYGFFSNGSLLKHDIIESMFAIGGWESVNFSINGFSPSVYEKVMPPLKRDRVYSNVNMMLEMKQRVGTGKPFVSISYVQLRQNINERRQFINYWKSIPGVDRVVLADCGDWLQHLGKAEKIATKRRRGSSSDTWLAPCPALWGSYYVYFDGRVVPCCEDSAGRQLTIGDANKTPLKDIFYGDSIMNLKRVHLNDTRAKHPICGKCRWNQSWF